MKGAVVERLFKVQIVREAPMAMPRSPHGLRVMIAWLALLGVVLASGGTGAQDDPVYARSEESRSRWAIIPGIDDAGAHSLLPRFR